MLAPAGLCGDPRCSGRSFPPLSLVFPADRRRALRCDVPVHFCLPGLQRHKTPLAPAPSGPVHKRLKGWMGTLPHAAGPKDGSHRIAGTPLVAVARGADLGVGPADLGRPVPWKRSQYDREIWAISIPILCASLLVPLSAAVDAGECAKRRRAGGVNGIEPDSGYIRQECQMLI